MSSIRSIQVRGTGYVVSTDCKFTLRPGGTLTAGVPATVTIAPVPRGINGTNGSHRVYISGGTGTPEAVLITGGTAVAGASSGTLQFTPANSHSGAWSITSASAGIQEAIFAAGVFGAVFVPAGVHDIYAPIMDAFAVGIYGIPQMSFLFGQFASGDVLSFVGQPNWTGFNNASCDGLTVYHNVTRTSGADFVLKWVQDGHFSQLRTANGYDGIRISGALHLQLTDIQLIDSHYGLHMFATTADINAGMQNAFQANGLRVSSAQEGIRVESNCTGTALNGVYVENTATSIHVLKPGVGAVNEFIVSDGFLDGFTVAAVYLDDGVPSNGMSFSNLRINAGAGGTSSYGFFATKDNYNVKICNNIIVAHDGVWMQGASGWTVMGNSIAPLNVGGRGVVMATNPCTNNLIVGNTIGYDATYQGSTGTVADKGIATDTAAHADNVVTSNRIKGSTAPVEWLATGTGNVINHNVGVDDVIPTVASATTITLPINPVVKITGTTAIQTINGGWPGRVVALIFTNAAPGGVATGGNIARAQTAAQNQRLLMTSDGTTWF
jgi:hypothetical protein